MRYHITAESFETRAGGNDTAVVLSFVVSDDMLAELALIDPAPAIQSHRFGLRLIDIMAQVFPDLSAVSFVPIQDYPIGSKIVFGRSEFRHRGIACRGLPFFNLVILKHVSRFLALLASGRQFLACDVLLVHGLHLPYLVFAVLLKLAGVRIGIALTDQQGVVLPTDGTLRAGLKRIDRWISVKFANQFDFSIALSNSLRDTYTPQSAAMVIPGIFDDGLALRVKEVQTKRSEKFRVLYFGGLHADYGIRELLDAASLIDETIEIRLFGSGPMANEIENSDLRDRNLFWGGLVDQSVLIEEMAHCDLLINPRPSGGLMAAYSSPSKLLEYAASGKPVLTTRLPSLPDGIVDAALIIEEETASGIAGSISHAAGLAPDELANFGARYHRAVLDICSVEAISDNLRSIALQR